MEKARFQITNVVRHRLCSCLFLFWVKIHVFSQITPKEKRETDRGSGKLQVKTGEWRVTYILHFVPFKVGFGFFFFFCHENVLLIQINKFKINIVSGLAWPSSSCFIPFEDRQDSSWSLALYFLPRSPRSARRSSLSIPAPPSRQGRKGARGPLQAHITESPVRLFSHRKGNHFASQPHFPTRK